MRKIKRDVRRYVLAALAAVAALYLRKLLNPFLGEDNPYHTIWLATVFSAWYCGIGPSIVALVLGLLGIWYWFLPPYHSFALKNQTEIFGMLACLAFSVVIVFFGESTRRRIRQREQAEEELRKAHQEVETRVTKWTADLEQRTAGVLEKATLLDLASDAMFVKTVNGTISYWNRGAERLYGWTITEALGRSPRELLGTEFPVPLTDIEGRDHWEGQLRQTKRDGSQIVVASRWTRLWDKQGEPMGWLEINTDITARKRAEDAARRLSGRILTLQDDERRRIARELHDSVGQFLTALKMNLDLLSSRDGDNAKLISQCSEIVDQCLTETRTISHLLHPPLLDEAGFGSAVEWYVDGFAKRSGIEVNLDLPPELGRLNREVETALFRAVQEALTNVHRHSGSSAVDICLRVDAEQVQLQIKDNGKGIPKKYLDHFSEDSTGSGVGIAGMRERVRELNGSLDIQSDRTGTTVVVTIPIVEKTSTDLAEADSGRTVSAA